MNYEELQSLCSSFIKLDEGMIKKFSSYSSLLKEWNEKMNLTSITEESEVIEKHFYDCLLPLKYVDLHSKRVADIGSGAGFPGLVWAICYPSSTFYLVEPTKKRCLFLEEVCKELELNNVKIINKRAEELPYRDSFDLVSARAVAPLPILLEISSPFAKIGGLVLAMKGLKGKEELRESKNAMSTLSLKLLSVNEDSLPNLEGERINILFKKNGPTQRKYPRAWADIEKKPL
ncbi:MAG: 16S rRNA (guanine(527)-N(7))-methyltransferase RsmG [Bacilli bacterium]|jgi:16S rRNA (guanine527-N7)-methyltransferase|nr:16S rRNA (guanine(527)-N(7))-methyltransferase RsmG [Bacilli bacterium]MCH4210846.1 16S rRNA (guanine(527)-N(7))-methyltransferase RsmG [Bacilli bacterium]MCH4228940.1 16S rRNA (guanine(527)-N(7))-methyltransferase RsmG [Bacilli bacterium]MCH4277760.1 16S rRNA (guanine(527)-N(7))-methyltransferase RsmG [Bacilli bacterium]MCI2054996.1 16S rRNA (guanine(527)-N(7))-methyltransferase RsmG [Bacilli bacterium]